VDGAVPPTVGPRAEVLSTDDSAWDRPPAGPPVPLPTRPARDTFSWPAGRDTPEPGPGWQPSRSESAQPPPDVQSQPGPGWEPDRSEPVRPAPDDPDVDPGGSAADRAGSDQPDARSEESA